MTTRQQTVARFRAATKRVTRSTTIALWLCFGIAAGLLVASFIVPPTGEIHASVLKGASLVFAFAGLFFLREAVMEGLGVKLTHGDTTIEIKDNDGNAKGNGEPMEPLDLEPEGGFPEYPKLREDGNS